MYIIIAVAGLQPFIQLITFHGITFCKYNSRFDYRICNSTELFLESICKCDLHK